METSLNAPIDSILKAIGENLALRLKQSRVSQKELAEATGLNRNTIHATLSGCDVKLSTLIRITRYMDSREWLIPLLELPPVSPMEKLERMNPRAFVKAKNTKRSSSSKMTTPIPPKKRKIGIQKGRI